MRKLVATALVAVAGLALTAASAGASTGISTSPTTTTITFVDLDLNLTLGIDIRCDVIMDGTFESRIAKTVGARIARVDIEFGRCDEGAAGLLLGGRRLTVAGTYDVTYRSFSGTLPVITSLGLVINDVELWASGSGFTCLTLGAIDIAGSTSGGNPVTEITLNAGSIPVEGDDITCSPFLTFGVAGTGDLSTNVRLTLF